MNQKEANNFIKTISVEVQAKINRKRSLATKPLKNERFDASAAINQPQLTLLHDDLALQDGICKHVFDDVMQYIIKVSIQITFSI